MKAIRSKTDSAYSRPMRFLTTIKTMLGLSERQLALKIDASPQLINQWKKGAPRQRQFISTLCALRKLSGLSWQKFGAMLDDEFENEKNKKD